MKINVHDSDSLYYEIMDLLQEIKLSNGPLGVNGTLSRRSDLKSFITKKQKQKLNDLTLQLTELYNNISE